MIAKFDNVSGANLVTLLSFIHSDENCVELAWTKPTKNVIVTVKSVTPPQSIVGGYNITLEITEYISKSPTGGMNRVDPKYLLRVYLILGLGQKSGLVSEDKSPVSEECPRIPAGTKVRTTQANMELCKDFTREAWYDRKWGVFGIVIGHHDSHGLCYEVDYGDGTTGYHDPSEIEVIPAGAS